MRRSIIIALLATAVPVAWVFWRPARTAVPAPTRAATPAPADRAAARAPVRLALARVDHRLPVARGLCGTEIERPLLAAEARRVPEALRTLAKGVPNAETVVATAEEWGIEVPAGLDLAERLADAEARRRELEADLVRPAARDEEEDDDGPGSRLATLRDLGRPREALALAQQEHARDPSAVSALTVASLLDDAGRPAEARRMLETDLARAEDDPRRAWIHSQLGFLCATRGDLECARKSTQALERLDTEGGLGRSLATFTRAVERTFAGRLDEARAEYLKASEDDSEDFPTLNNLAEVEGCLGRPQESRQRWLQAAEEAVGPEGNASVFAGLGLTHLRDGDVAPAWIMASAGLVAAGNGSFSADVRLVMSLTALTMGDLEEARAQVARAREADPDDDLQRRRCFAHPAEAASARALVAEGRGDLDGARQAWVEVARSGHAALSAAARDALGALCP